jgi:hypothetical protein
MTTSEREKKEMIRKAMMDRTRCHIGRDGVTPRVSLRFRTAWDGTPSSPHQTDVIRVKIHDTYHGDVGDIVRGLCASCDDVEYLGYLRCWLFFGRRRRGADDTGAGRKTASTLRTLPRA